MNLLVTFGTVLIALVAVGHSAVVVREEELQRRAEENLRRYGQKVTAERLLGLSGNYGLLEVLREETANGGSSIKYQETYMKINVTGFTVVLEEENGQLTSFVYGRLLEQLEKDDLSPKARADEQKAVAVAMKYVGVETRNYSVSMSFYAYDPDRVENQSYKEEEKDEKSPDQDQTDDSGAKKPEDPAVKPILAYFVTLFYEASRNSNASNLVLILDANTGEVKEKRDEMTSVPTLLTNAKGGNDKIGQYVYGSGRWSGRPLYGETFGPNCYLLNSYVTVYHCHNTWGICPVAQCSEIASDSVNGAYSPLSDAYFFTKETQVFLKNWYGDNTLPSAYGPIKVRVHYGVNYQNAYWQSSSQTTTYGDGGSIFHPLTVADVVSHELAHALTTATSGLIYSGQSGGINEAFSDITGTTFKHYLEEHYYDWFLGGHIMKKEQALRYMENPELDGKSIGCAREYKGQNVHYTSGVYNKAFYNLVNTPGWNMKRAYAVFLRANKFYWTAGTNYNQGACGVRTAAINLGYNPDDVDEAFAKVGVFCKCPAGFVRRNDWSCYKFVEDIGSWAEARVYCKSMGADLTAIEDSSEEYWIQTYIRTNINTLSHPSFNVPDFWIGGMDMQSEGSWRFPPTSNSYASVFFWLAGEPDSTKTENCLSMRWSKQWPGLPAPLWTFQWRYYWHDDKCYEKKLFICERSCKTWKPLKIKIPLPLPVPQQPTKLNLTKVLTRRSSA